MKTVKPSFFQSQRAMWFFIVLCSMMLPFTGLSAFEYMVIQTENGPQYDFVEVDDEMGYAGGDIISQVVLNSYSLNNIAGPEYRKIGMTGYPMPDSKPQQESETDYSAEETYVDALTLGLQHNVTDIFVPLASGQFALGIRRNYQPSTYNVPDTPPDDDVSLVDASKAFGPCWTSGLDCGLQIVTAYSYNESHRVESMNAGYRSVTLVTDENGQIYRFGTLHDGTFLPLPSSSVNVDVANLSLTHTNNAYVFKRRYGNAIVFNDTYTVADGSSPILSAINEDGEQWGILIGSTILCINTNSVVVGYDRESETFLNEATNSVPVYPKANYERRERYRPQYVEDRHGNKLVYEFSENRLVPDRIKALDSSQSVTNFSDLAISISLNSTNGCVESVTDPRGYTVSYSYTNSATNYRRPGGVTLLTQANRESVALTKYNYDEKQIRKTTSDQGTYTDYHHLVLDAVEDANSNRYEFSWTTNATACALERWDWGDNAPISYEDLMTNAAVAWSNDLVRAANPLQLTSITHGTNTTYFSITQAASLTRPTVLDTAVQQTSVIDMSGSSWTYVFTNAYITNSLDRPFLGTIENEGLSANRSDTLFYQEMHLYDDEGECESFRFDPDAGLALSESIDYFGNTTRFYHEDPANYSSLGSNANAIIMAIYLPDDLSRPTSQINPLSYTRSYTYETNFNQKATLTDELERLTEFEFDEFGNRINIIKYAEDGGGLSLTEMEYTNIKFPNFMTKQIVKDLNDSNDPSWGTNLVTGFEPHEYGQVGRKIVDLDGVPLETVYDYDKNNNLISVIDPNGNMTSNRYDSLNRLVEISFFDGTNTLKSTKKYWYDPRGNKTWEKDENDHYSYFQYDSRNNCTNTVRIMGGTSNPANGYTSHVDDIVTSSEYNTLGGLAATVDPRGLRAEFQYDYLQRLTNMIVGANLPIEQQQITSYEYGTNSGGSVFSADKWKPVRITDPRGYITEIDYNALYRPVETRAQIAVDGGGDPVFSVTRNLYDAVGNLLSVSNKVNSTDWQVTETIYDDLNRPVQLLNADGTTNQIAYTSTGLKWKTIDEMGRESEVQYDAAGRPVKTISPEITSGVYAITETGYDANGNVAWVQDASGNVTTNVYDYRNRPTHTIAPEVWDAVNEEDAQPVVITAYDDIGNVISVTDAHGNVTTNVYDANNRLIVTIAPEVYVYDPQSQVPSAQHPVTSNFYDKAGNITNTVDANERSVQMQYDAFGRLTNTVDAITSTISFEYDKNGNQTALIDGEGNRTEFVCDGLNRKTSTIYPAVGGTSAREDAEYDLLGNRIMRIDCNGGETIYNYDDRNRLDLVLYMDGSTTSRTRDYSYDDAGNLLSVIESDGTNADVAYSYDALNRVTNETSVGITHTYQYDLNGNRTNALYGVTDRQVAWTYDALNRITQITDNDSQITMYSYDLNSKPIYREYPTGVEELRTFDAMGRLLTMTTTNSVNGESFIMEYEYDLVGSALKMEQNSWNLTGKAQDALTTWGYDDRYRLTNETVRTAGVSPATNITSYAWDSADNRLSKTEHSGGALASVTVYTNNALNQLLGYEECTAGVSPATNVVEFAYDSNGARTNKTEVIDDASGLVTNVIAYIYDEDNRLIEVGGANSPSEPPDTTHTFAYDYRSRRYYRETPAGTNLCVFDGGLSIQEYTVPQASSLPTSATLTTEFVRGEGMGGGVGGMVYSITTNGIICSHANHRGDVIARTDMNAELTSFALYEAYGTRPYEWGTDPDRQKANTKEEEKDLGLLNEGMRYRDLETGTFLTRDPIGYEDGPNMYCYVHCNPITHFDAFGLEDEPTVQETEDGTSMNGETATDKTITESTDQPATDVKAPSDEGKKDNSEPDKKEAEKLNDQQKADKSKSELSQSQSKQTSKERRAERRAQRAQERLDRARESGNQNQIDRAQRSLDKKKAALFTILSPIAQSKKSEIFLKALDAISSFGKGTPTPPGSVKPIGPVSGPKVSGTAYSKIAPKSIKPGGGVKLPGGGVFLVPAPIIRMMMQQYNRIVNAPMT